MFVVLKFGGTSVANRKNWENIGRIAARSLAENVKPVLVCSAIAGVSNDLEEVARRLKAGENYEPLWDKVQNRHQALAEELGVCFERISVEACPRTQADIMALGELWLTRLGVDFLRRQGFSVAWVDARDCLVAKNKNPLAANCFFDPDSALISRFSAMPESMIVTQGFIARNPEGHTVLLGRGGSDTSAAYFAAKLQASRCEIWTDVAGMYTANPREIPEARLLKQLDYDEAQEIATMGAKVLHPRCLAPVKQFHIPMFVRSTGEPERAGTLIGDKAPLDAPCVKAISTKSNITLLAIENLGMWQEAGFLADLFACFKQHGISIDLVSTSESNVTVSIDPVSNALDPTLMNQLIESIQKLGSVTVMTSCAIVSLVGHHIRSILHQLGPALEVFEEQKVYLVSQAASDLNLTFVVDEQARVQLVQRLHHLLFDAQYVDSEHENRFWWHDQQIELLALSKTASPLYVYDQTTLVQSATKLLELMSVDRVFYALKANDHEDILKTLFELGLGFECVSQGELQRVLDLFPGLNPNRILFTPNFAPKQEYAFALSKNCHVTLDSLSALEQWPELFAGKQIFLRLDPGEGRGHHQHVKTAGEQSKFGISVHEVPLVLDWVERHQIQVVGLHAHAGSGIMDAHHWARTARFLIEMAGIFKDVKILDLGGGLAVPNQMHEEPLNLKNLDDNLRPIRAKHPEFEFWLEPGRYLVAQAGVLLAQVTQLKEKNGVSFVGVDAGMNSLIRPMLYGAYHPIVNLTHLEKKPQVTAHVVGPICESGDTLGYDRRLPNTSPGDVLLIANTGAYGRVMSSHYNRRQPAGEYFLKRIES